MAFSARLPRPAFPKRRTRRRKDLERAFPKTGNVTMSRSDAVMTRHAAMTRLAAMRMMMTKTAWATSASLRARSRRRQAGPVKGRYPRGRQGRPARRKAPLAAAGFRLRRIRRRLRVERKTCRFRRFRAVRKLCRLREVRLRKGRCRRRRRSAPGFLPRQVRPALPRAVVVAPFVVPVWLRTDPPAARKARRR